MIYVGKAIKKEEKHDLTLEVVGVAMTAALYSFLGVTFYLFTVVVFMLD